jgi:hypothetical protein
MAWPSSPPSNERVYASRSVTSICMRRELPRFG